MSATKQESRGVVEIARELVAAIEAAVDPIERAHDLSVELADVATGNRGVRDERVVRFGYALGEDARSWSPTYLRDTGLPDSMESGLAAARELLELAEAACSRREAVAS